MVEKGAERATIVVDIFDIIQQVRDTSIHLIYSGRQACGRIGRGHTGEGSHRISHPPSFCGAYLNFSREKDSGCSGRPQTR